MLFLVAAKPPIVRKEKEEKLVISLTPRLRHLVLRERVVLVTTIMWLTVVRRLPVGANRVPPLLMTVNSWLQL